MLQNNANTRQPAFSVDEIFREGESVELQHYIKSVLNYLPDHRQKEVEQTQEFVIQKGVISEMQAAISAAANQAAEDYIANNPKAASLSFHYSGRVSARRYSNVNYTQAFRQMLDYILDRQSDLNTQSAILDAVKYSTGIRELSANIWKLPLKRFMLGIIKKKLTQHALTISLAGCKDMSDVRKAIEAYFTKQAAIHKAKLDITLTPAKLLINGTSYNISTKTAGKSEYDQIRVNMDGKRIGLRIDALKALFGMPA